MDTMLSHLRRRLHYLPLPRTPSSIPPINRIHQPAVRRASLTHHLCRNYSIMPSNCNNIRIVGGAEIVVDHEGLTINECIGNVATKTDDVSVCVVSIANPTAEPWLTIQYDEYMHVLEGVVELHFEKNDGGNSGVVRVAKGQTLFIEKGSRFQPRFPEGNTRYIPVCLPAFKPERCHREEGSEVSDVAAKLEDLHSDSKQPTPEEINEKYNHIAKIYHMCLKSKWEQCLSASTKAEAVYYPPTFHQDGRMIHATAQPERLLKVANHFYKKTDGEWICIELNRIGLEELGVVTVFEGALPVGNKEAIDECDWVFPHIYGGIPTHVDGIVVNTFGIKRSEDGEFLLIEGLAE
jgi:mannose-6-phosphate isomerase-like protein (cupin superfamily)